jgi:mono/diheme cytochrome c family protein
MTDPAPSHLETDTAAPRRVPLWAAAALVALPMWAVLYGGSFGTRASASLSPVHEGSVIYRSVGCSACHGPTGEGGGAVPALTAADRTFPDFADHEAWVRTGSALVRGQTYGSGTRVATGGMPSFPSLTDAQVRAVVCYERATFSKVTPPEGVCS